MQVLVEGMRFTLRDGTRTLGYGIVTECHKDMDIAKYNVERKKLKKKRLAEQAEKEQNM